MLSTLLSNARGSCRTLATAFFLERTTVKPFSLIDRWVCTVIAADIQMGHKCIADTTNQAY